MFIPFPIEYFTFNIWTKNRSCSSYCNEFYVFLIFFRFQRWSPDPLDPFGSNTAEKTSGFPLDNYNAIWTENGLETRLLCSPRKILPQILCILQKSIRF